MIVLVNEANGVVGDADPLQAPADALSLFGADRVAIAPQCSNWLARDLVARARRRFALPILELAA
jgi:hypothetical protein